MINKKQEERLDYLLEEFKKDSIWYKDLWKQVMTIKRKEGLSAL